ncbi:hypothetical protein [Streptomyces sp. NPDC017988]|uniref:hypothetical protein n=1 Tax=Streptomyces sp. NPDC017988 TaxID=3365025 RepID=UPI0037BBE5C4
MGSAAVALREDRPGDRRLIACLAPLPTGPLPPTAPSTEGEDIDHLVIGDFVVSKK